MTYLLKLVKYYKPEANYDCLTRTGQELLKIDGRDWPIGINTNKNLTKPTELEDGGKYIHFGLESALNLTLRVSYTQTQISCSLSVFTERIHHCYRLQYEKRLIKPPKYL